ncbi:MAG: FxsA family protein [Pseudomonadota bacterium]
MSKSAIIFIATALTELSLLIYIGQYIGVLPVIINIILTAILGIMLVKRQGFSALKEAQHTLNQGQIPLDSILETVLIGLAGVLLIIPGLITDLLGVITFITPLRRWSSKRLITTLLKSKKFDKTFTSKKTSNNETIVDFEDYTVINENQNETSEKAKAPLQLPNSENQPPKT